jgi:hypothetical protein
MQLHAVHDGERVTHDYAHQLGLASIDDLVLRLFRSVGLVVIPRPAGGGHCQVSIEHSAQRRR